MSETPKTIEVGQRIKHDFKWASGRDVGDGEIVGVGPGWVTIQEDFYDLVVLYRGDLGDLLPLVTGASDD